MNDQKESTNGSLIAAVELGRHGRGRNGAEEWSRVRALVLRELGRGLTRARVGGMLGLSSQRVTQLREEGCEAVLRGGADSLDAEQACAGAWERWCVGRGDEAACARLKRVRAA